MRNLHVPPTLFFCRQMTSSSHPLTDILHQSIESSRHAELQLRPIHTIDTSSPRRCLASVKQQRQQMRTNMMVC